MFLSRISLVGATKERTVLPLNFAQFTHACGVPDVLEAVSMQPAEALPCLSVAVHEVSIGAMSLSTPTLKPKVVIPLLYIHERYVAMPLHMCIAIARESPIQVEAHPRLLCPCCYAEC